MILRVIKGRMFQPLLCTPAESLRVATAAKTPEVVDLSGADSDSKNMLVSVTLMFISVTCSYRSKHQC